MRFSIGGLISGGLRGTVAGGLGGAVGGALVIVGIWALGGPSGWEEATILAASIFPALGGFIGGSTAGACGRIGFLGPAIGGLLGAWLQGGTLVLLMTFSADYDLIEATPPQWFTRSSSSWGLGPLYWEHGWASVLAGERSETQGGSDGPHRATEVRRPSACGR